MAGDAWWASRAYLESVLTELMMAIDDTPGWRAEAPCIGPHGAISCLARHNDEESARLIRSIGEWQDELRTHVCEPAEQKGERHGG